MSNAYAAKAQQPNLDKQITNAVVQIEINDDKDKSKTNQIEEEKKVESPAAISEADDSCNLNEEEESDVYFINLPYDSRYIAGNE